MDIELQPQSEIEETVIVTATRAERRIEDEPLRVEVVPAEEVQEKIAMAPGDVRSVSAKQTDSACKRLHHRLGARRYEFRGSVAVIRRCSPMVSRCMAVNPAQWAFFKFRRWILRRWSHQGRSLRPLWHVRRRWRGQPRISRPVRGALNEKF